ncbi:uncharacterized protein LOC144704479 [Wolffia australiana]
MESLFHPNVNPSLPSSQTIPSSPSSSMAAPHDVFGFLDLPFILYPNPSSNPNPNPNPLPACSFLPESMQGPLMALPTSSSPVPSNPKLHSLSPPCSQAFAGGPAANSSSRKRGGRKRARSSQRAPTTVLVTNRCNFRAMVQEFTGVPSTHFAAPPLPGSQLGVFHDVLGSSSWFSEDFDTRFPALSTLLMPSGEGIISGIENNPSKFIFSNAMMFQ